MLNTKHAGFTSVFWRSLGVFLLGLPMAANAVLIDNGVAQGTIGHLQADVLTGGQSRNLNVTASRLGSQDTFTENVLFDYSSFVDPGNDGNAFTLFGSEPVRDPNNPNVVTSMGSFVGANQNTILWTAVSSIVSGRQVLTTRYTFASADGSPLGSLRFLQYLDEDVEIFSTNVFVPLGSAATGNLELFTSENTQIYGVSQSGAFFPGLDLQNASFAGWAADRFPNMGSRIRGIGQPVSVAGVIGDLQSFQHPQLGLAFGPADIVSVLAWDLDPNAARAEITSTLGGEAAVIEAAPASAPIRCQEKSCRVLIVCISPDLAVPCNNAVTLSARPPRRSSVSEISGELREGTRANATQMVPFAIGAATNVPPGQIANVKLNTTKRGRRLARSLVQSGVKRLSGVMSISNVAGFATLRIPVRIKLK